MQPLLVARTSVGQWRARARITSVEVTDRLRLIESGDVDVSGLDDGRQRLVVGAFQRLCHALAMPVAVHILVRPHVASLATAADTHEANTRWVPRGFSRRIVIAVDPCHADRETVAVTVRLIHTTLATAGLASRDLRAHERGTLMRELLGADDGTAVWDEHLTSASINGVSLAGVVLTALPGAPVQPGWLAPLMTAQTPCNIRVTFSPVPHSTAQRHLARKLRALRSDQLLRSDRGILGDAAVDSSASAADMLRTRLADRSNRPLDVCVTAVARGDSPATAATGLRTLIGAIEAAQARARPTHGRHLTTALQCWPLATTGLQRGKLMDSSAAATVLPWAVTRCEDPGGYRLGRAAEAGTGVAVAPFATTVHPNANVVVLARSGQGKSYAIGALVLEAAVHGVNSVVVDPEGEYGAVIRATGGRCLALTPGAAAALNVLDLDGAPPSDDLTPLQARVAQLISMLVGTTVTADERDALDDATARAVARWVHDPASRVPTLEDVLDALPPEHRLARLARRFTVGAFGALFNRPTTLTAGVGGLCLDLSGLERELVAPVTYLLAEWLWAVIRRDRTRRHLVFDEVGLLTEHEPLRALLVRLARRCRKYETSLIVATQNAGDLLRSADGTVVATNPAIALLGGHRGAELDTMERAFGLSAKHRGFLEQAGRGQFLLIAGDRRLAVDIDVPDGYHEVLVDRRRGEVGSDAEG